MVQNGLDQFSIVEEAERLDFPDSVIDFMNGRIGVPAGGFPEPFRSRVLNGKEPTVPDGSRPGIGLEPFDFDAQQKTMAERLSKPYVHYKDVLNRTDNTEYFCYNDLVSASMYPDVHRDFMTHISKYSDTSIIPTPYFFS
jgi:pyruvate carboxylase